MVNTFFFSVHVCVFEFYTKKTSKLVPIIPNFSKCEKNYYFFYQELPLDTEFDISFTTQMTYMVALPATFRHLLLSWFACTHFFFQIVIKST